MQKYLFLILFLVYVSCGKKEQQNQRYSQQQIASLHLDSTITLIAETDSLIRVNFNPFLKRQNFDFGSLIKEIKLIPLETTDESLVDDIYKIIISDSNIYIMDNFKGRGIIIFDKDGKFIKRIPNGPGPGELVRLYDIAYDTKSNELVAYQHSFLLFYTSKGEYIRHKKLPFAFKNFTVIPDGYIFKALDRQGNEHLGNLKDYTLFITDKDFKLKSIGLSYPPKGSVLEGYNYLYNNGTIKITQGYTDTIYEYLNKTNELKAKYMLDYGIKKLPDRYLHCNSFSEFDNTIRQNDYYFYLGRYIETNTHNVFFLENYTIGRTVIYRDKQSGNLIGGTNADYNMNEVPPCAFPISMSGNWLISAYLPDQTTSLLSNSSIISNEDKQKIKDLTEDDNPTLVFFQLNDF